AGTPLRNNAESKPPHRQSRQAGEPAAGKRAAVVAANPLRQAVFGKCARQPTLRRRQQRPRQRITAQDIAAGGIPQRQGVTLNPIAGAELALEIDGPDFVDARDGDERCRRDSPPAAPPRTDQPGALQQLTPGAACRPRSRRFPPPQPADQFASSPRWVTPPRRLDRFANRLVDGARGVMRPPRLVDEAHHPGGLVTGHPLVAGLPTDAIVATQIDHRAEALEVLADELRSEIHG